MGFLSSLLKKKRRADTISRVQRGQEEQSVDPHGSGSRCTETPIISESSGSGSTEPSVKEDPHQMRFGLASVFPYEELVEATNNFHESQVLGGGAFGRVYLGKLRDGREVAVKKLYDDNQKMLEQFFNEVTILSRIRHKNLISLHGCTYPNSRQLLLVYEFAPNGTVEDHLHGQRPSLPWRVRILIAIEIAEALAYLHSVEPAIIHRDIKTANILLDNAFHVKVADLGMCRLLPWDTTSVSTAPQGTGGYRDPEYDLYYNLTTKSDVYSFGVVLLELVSGKKAVDVSRHLDEIYLVRMALDKIINKELEQLVDPELGYHSDCEVRIMINAVAELACKCLRTKGHMRPSMVQVLKVLKEIQDGKQHIVGSHSTQACVFSHEELHEATKDGKQYIDDSHSTQACVSSHEELHEATKDGKQHIDDSHSRKLHEATKDGKQHIDDSQSTQACLFSHEELFEATNSFDPSRKLRDDKLNKVYLGKLRDGQMVAVKVLKDCKSEQLEQMFKDVTVISRLHHKNLVTLYGCTNPRRQGMLLVYEYVPSVTVADRLHIQRPALPWSVRIQIAIETSNVLAYLHSLEMPIIHRYVNSSNILLDNAFNVKVAGLGMFYETVPQGKLGYRDPQFSACHPHDLTEKSDVYSLGVMLVELISGQQVGDVDHRSRECYLVSMALNMIINKKLEKLVDPELGFHSGSEVSRIINSVAGLAFRCLRLRGKMRPSMEEVFTVLNALKDGAQDSGLVVNVAGRFIQACVFPHEELHAATNSFDSSQELTDGSIDKVYYGKLRGGRRVAVKVLHDRDPYKLGQIFDEVPVISLLCHKNLVTLYGCTNRLGCEMSLVYEYVPNGSIAEHLYDKRLVLNWALRIQIAIETTEALAYLHSLEPSIIHGYVKTSNILLDSSFHVKVASLGLCHGLITPQGRLGYFDPEYKDYSGCKLTCKSDVYSLGVVLVELISGKQPDRVIEGLGEFAMVNIALNKIINNELETLVDSKLGYNSDVEVKKMVNSVAKLAFRCLQLEGGMRPPMLEVLEVLKEIKLGKQCIHNKEREEEEVDVACRVFSHEELHLATDSSNPSGDFQGNRGKVFLGILDGGQKVLVKNMGNRHFSAYQKLFDEIRVVTHIHHKNLVTLYGCTKPRNDQDVILLVYEYVSNCGTLEALLFGGHGDENKTKRLALNWALRFQIAMETAEAISYLHRLDSPILHTDVTASSILLDENFHVKVIGLTFFIRDYLNPASEEEEGSDFSTEKEGTTFFTRDYLNQASEEEEGSDFSTEKEGTRGYLDPASENSSTTQSDIYSFGVILMELISGRPAYDENESGGEEYLAVVAPNKIHNKKLDELVDINLDYHSNLYTKRMVTLVAELACKCLLPEWNRRPSMTYVSSSLKEISMRNWQTSDS